MAYLYRHIRLDKNEPFYVGIGSDDKGEYKRAHQTKSRNNHWQSVVAKTKYEIEIILDDLDWESAKRKEIEFIAMYGRADLKKGPLVNKTDGGDGQVNVITSEETRAKKRIASTGRKLSKEAIEKMRATHLGCKRSEETRLNISKSKKNEKGIEIACQNLKSPKREINLKIACQKRVVQYSIDGYFIKEWNSIREITEYYKNIRQSTISSCCKGKYNTAGGFRWKFYKEGYPTKLSNTELAKPITNHGKKVYQYDTSGEFIREWKSAAEATKFVKNTTRQTISQCCNNKQKTSGGFKWSYKNEHN